MLPLHRLLKPEYIKLDAEIPQPIDADEDPVSCEKSLWIVKKEVLKLLVELLEKTGNVQNPKKLFYDLLNREKKASTGLEQGVAIPHVRTMQVKDISVCFVRSKDEIDFGSYDGVPCRLFFGVVAPPYYDENDYLKLYRKIASLMKYESIRNEFLLAKSHDEIIRILRENE